MVDDVKAHGFNLARSPYVYARDVEKFSDEVAMRLALEQARLALPDVPIGAVVLDEAGEVIAAARNRREADADPTAHAEILALRGAGAARGRWHLGGCTLVVTLEPCTMCAGALVLGRLDRLVFGARDPKTGAAGSVRVYRAGRSAG